MSRTIPKNGHWKAHEPDEFADWMSNIRNCAISMGMPKLTPTKQDLEDTEKYYKSAWLVKPAKAGQLIEEAFFEYKRPGSGVSSKVMNEKFIGQKFERDFCAGEMFEN